MTTVAILADPPRPGLALPDVSSSLLTDDERATLAEAMLADVCAAADASGGDVLANYRDPADLSDFEGDPKAVFEAVLETAVDDPPSIRSEVQVGSNHSARVGNTITHLLEREGVDTAAVLHQGAPLVTRQQIDSAAMKLRSSEVVLGPSTDGRVYYAGFAESIDFEGAWATPTVETLVERARAEGYSVDLLPTLPVLERTGDLATVVASVRARERASRRTPQHTLATIDDLGLSVEGDEDDEAVVVRD